MDCIMPGCSTVEFVCWFLRHKREAKENKSLSRSHLLRSGVIFFSFFFCEREYGVESDIPHLLYRELKCDSEL